MATSTTDVKELIAKKESIEAEMKQLLEVLDAQNGVGMNGRLVDAENFPRSDIDVYAVRVARNQIIRLQNDHKALMNDIEKGLHAVHAEAREKRVETRETREEVGIVLQPFASIQSVAPYSPADQAGLRIGDKLIQFGSISCNNFQTLEDISTLVQHSIERSIRVCVHRGNHRAEINLIPKRWEGRALLGCKIVPSNSM
ncbi:26S proteasome non-ATPase regulatory subunit 9-like isoform X2 [Corticium candelabrum]|uniref:26S proteasome non-ATPase regulatory subunit 9-like isoform X2 n=1 Tax=Corticium candelabrum TaxID=121492 RepID=UPI002E25BDAC|nr:26S proteasome non-ATPase regulatory subunit 9-like isoform X2 [Corticium candelabrum]